VDSAQPPVAASVRRASRADADEIAAVAVRSWRVGYRGIVPASVEPEWAWSPQRVAALLAPGRGRPGSTLVAEASGRIAGFAVLGASRDDDAPPGTGEIRSLYVDPDRWRRGIGRRLVEAALRELAAARYRVATVWTPAELERNVRFYEALGFRRDGATQRRESFGGPLELRLRIGLSADRLRRFLEPKEASTRWRSRR
jgi:ribosomal protein S18 acetylase RimI-like enzyme